VERSCDIDCENAVPLPRTNFHERSEDTLSCASDKNFRPPQIRTNETKCLVYSDTVRHVHLHGDGISTIGFEVFRHARRPDAIHIEHGDWPALLGKAATNRFAYARASAGDDRDGMPACG
jgi:hypothetical protein